MLTVLLHSGLGDIVAVVTRYFGGVKLGKGGLVKAYSGGVKYALETLPRAEKIPKAVVEVVIHYSHVTLFERMLNDYDAEALGEEFAQDVSYQLLMPLKTRGALHSAPGRISRTAQALVAVHPLQ